MSVVYVTIQELREKDTRMCFLWRKASRKIMKGKMHSQISCIILFSYQARHMCMSIYVTKF